MTSLNVLIVEDQLIIYTHLIKTLNSFGYKNIFVARSGDKAIEIANSRKIDLIFSDIKIHGEIDGVDAVLTIQSLYNTPVIFITAYKDKEILKRVSNLDIIGYLLKPYRIDELEALVYIAIEKYQLHERNNTISYKNFIYNLSFKKLFLDDIEIELSKKEQYFIHILFENLNKLISYETLDYVIWEDCCVSENTRRTFIYRFRNKFPQLNLKIEKTIGIGLFN